MLPKKAVIGARNPCSPHHRLGFAYPDRSTERDTIYLVPAAPLYRQENRGNARDFRASHGGVLLMRRMTRIVLLPGVRMLAALVVVLAMLADTAAPTVAQDGDTVPMSVAVWIDCIDTGACNEVVYVPIIVTTEDRGVPRHLHGDGRSAIAAPRVQPAGAGSYDRGHHGRCQPAPRRLRPR